MENYFNLPRNEREVYGLYKVPLSLPCDIFDEHQQKGWTEFYSRIKREYPLQWLFRYWMFSYENPLYKYFKEVYWKTKDIKSCVRLFISPCHPRWRKVLPRHRYSDITELIITANFALILDFYYEEVENGWVDWSSTKHHQKFYDQLTEYVKWIEEDSKNLEEKITKALTDATVKKIYKKDGSFDYEQTYKKLHRLEEEKQKKETEILKWFVDNRDRFWT